MKQDLHLTLLFPFLLVVLLASAALPLGARADDSTPVPPDGTTISPLGPAGGEFTPTPTATPGALTINAGPLDTALTPPAAQADTITLPAETTLAVLDSNGEELPLASTEAAEILAVGDPIWCPEGVSPVASTGGCTGSFGDLAALVAFLSGSQPAQNGTIWILNGTDSSLASVTLDGSILTTWKDNALTLQGGWGGSSAGTIVGQTTFSVGLKILGWADDITLNDLIFSTTGSDGVSVTTSGNIKLDEVESKSSNLGRGAYLNNTSGGSAVGVTVSESSFHDNLTGLDIYTYGDISLTYVDASNNVGVGTLIEDAKKVGITRSDFSWNDQQGLHIVASNDVSLSDVDARHNGNDGAWITSGRDITIATANFDRNSGVGLDASAVRMISLTDVDTSNNDDSGLYLISDRDVTLTEVTASANGDLGAQIWAHWNILVDDSIFNDNDQDGASLDSLSGDITVGCSDFWNNDDYGVDANLPGLLDLSGDSFVGNAAGDYTVSGGGGALVRPNPDCDPEAVKTRVPTRTPDTRMTMHVVHVVDGQIVTLDCTAYRGTVLVLSNGNQVVLPCPTTGQASLASVDRDGLPQVLDGELTFVSAMDAQVTPLLDGVMFVDFVIPFGQADANFSILRWDDTRWADLHGVRTEEGFFEAASSLDGVFVLVSK